MKPEGKTLHSWASMAIFLAGILADLPFIIDARRIENPMWCVCVRDRQRRLVIGFDKLDECTLKAALLEYAEPAVSRGIMAMRSAKALEILLSLGSGYSGTLNREYTWHQTALSGYSSSVFLTNARNWSATAPSMMR